MNERYDKPFFVGKNNQRFRGQSIDGFLPALEPPQEEILPSSQVAGKMYVNLRVDKHSQRLDKRLSDLEDIVNEHLDKKKRIHQY